MINLKYKLRPDNEGLVSERVGAAVNQEHVKIDGSAGLHYVNWSLKMKI